MGKIERERKAKQPEVGRMVASVDITGVPDALAAMRLELSKLLRNEAERGWQEGEQTVVDQAVRQSLMRVADIFEAGLKSAKDIE